MGTYSSSCSKPIRLIILFKMQINFFFFFNKSWNSCPCYWCFIKFINHKSNPYESIVLIQIFWREWITLMNRFNLGLYSHKHHLHRDSYGSLVGGLYELSKASFGGMDFKLWERNLSGFEVQLKICFVLKMNENLMGLECE